MEASHDIPSEFTSKHGQHRMNITAKHNLKVLVLIKLEAVEVFKLWLFLVVIFRNKQVVGKADCKYK